MIGKSCNVDADCGAAHSGLICASDVCRYGCRGRGGNDCPAAFICSSHSSAAGSCDKPDGPYASEVDAGTATEPPKPLRLYGGGGRCSVVAAGASYGFDAPLLWLGLGALLRRRKRS